jgi:hypothetical protein
MPFSHFIQTMYSFPWENGYHSRSYDIFFSLISRISSISKGSFHILSPVTIHLQISLRLRRIKIVKSILNFLQGKLDAHLYSVVLIITLQNGPNTISQHEMVKASTAVVLIILLLHKVLVSAVPLIYIFQPFEQFTDFGHVVVQPTCVSV